MGDKIMILCSDGPHHKYLIKILSSRFDIAGIVIEPYGEQIRRALREKKYVNYFYMKYHLLRRKVMGYTRYRNRFFACGQTVVEKSQGTKIIEVNDINAQEVILLANKIHPDVVIVMGTSIIKQKTLSALGGTIINIHGGYLPDYKGNHCFFFALYNRDYGKVASTIHYVNAGVDTGEIIERIYPQLTTEDNAETLYCKAEKEAIHRLSALLNDFICGKPFSMEQQQGPGKIYLTRDRKPYHEFFMAMKKTKIAKEIKNYE